MTAFLVLVFALELLPTDEGPVQDTISMYALGPYGGVLRVALVFLASGSYTVGAKFRRAIPGRCGLLLAGLTGIWATGSLIDAIVDPSPSGEWTRHGDIHVQVAVLAFGALSVASTTFVTWFWVQGGRVRAALLPTVWVLGSAAAQIVVTEAHLVSWGGVSERLVFASAVCWMLAVMKLVDRPDTRDCSCEPV